MNFLAMDEIYGMVKKIFFGKIWTLLIWLCFCCGFGWLNLKN